MVYGVFGLRAVAACGDFPISTKLVDLLKYSCVLRDVRERDDQQSPHNPNLSADAGVFVGRRPNWSTISAVTRVLAQAYFRGLKHPG